MASIRSVICLLLTYPILVIFTILSVIIPFIFYLGFHYEYVRYVVLAYIVFVNLDRSPQRGGFDMMAKCGATKFLRQGFWWRFSREYFEKSSFNRTVELPVLKGSAPQTYIFACHPHGVIGVAIMSNFGTDTTGFAELFPGIDVHLLGASAIFRIPIFREWVMAHGHGTIDRKTFKHILGKGHSVAMSVGGAREALYAEPKTMKLIMKERKGFVKVALQEGSALVPVITFGENELYSILRPKTDSWMMSIQMTLHRIMGYSMPVFFGQWWMPLLPRTATELATVAGAPLNLGRDPIPQPTQEQIDELHAEYIKQLCELYDQHKDANGYGDVPLVLI